MRQREKEREGGRGGGEGGIKFHGAPYPPTLMYFPP